jgi:hypothetical protein
MIARRIIEKAPPCASRPDDINRQPDNGHASGHATASIFIVMLRRCTAATGKTSMKEHRNDAQ